MSGNGEENNSELITFSKDDRNEQNGITLSVLSLGTIIFVCVVISIVLGLVLLYGLQRNNYIFKNKSYNSPMALVASSTTKCNRIFNRVGRTCNENKENKNKASTPNAMGQTPKCQTVLVVTSVKNGKVANKSICSTKISRRSSSENFNNCIPSEEDVSPRRALLI